MSCGVLSCNALADEFRGLGSDVMCSLQEFINFTLHYIADLDIPIKRYVQNHIREFPQVLALY